MQKRIRFVQVNFILFTMLLIGKLIYEQFYRFVPQ